MEGNVKLSLYVCAMRFILTYHLNDDEEKRTQNVLEKREKKKRKCVGKEEVVATRTANVHLHA